LQLKAAKGESIEEEEDLYKEIEVWKKNVLVGKRLKKSGETIFNIKQNFWDQFIKSFEIKLSVFDDFFEDKKFKEYFYKDREDGMEEEIRMGVPSTVLPSQTYNPSDERNRVISFLEQVGLVVGSYEFYKSKISSIPDEFPIISRLNFYENKYTLTNNLNEIKIEKYYNETPSQAEVDQFLKALVKSVYEKMKNVN